LTHSAPVESHDELQALDLQEKLAFLQAEHDRLNARERKLRKFVETELEKLKEIRGSGLKSVALKLSASKAKAEQAEWEKYTRVRSRYDKCYAELAEVIEAMQVVRNQLQDIDGDKDLPLKDAVPNKQTAILNLQHVIQSGDHAIQAIRKVKKTLIGSKKVAWWRIVVLLFTKGHFESQFGTTMDKKLGRLINKALRKISRFKSELQQVNRQMGWPMVISQFIAGRKSYVHDFATASADVIAISIGVKACDAYIADIRKQMDRCKEEICTLTDEPNGN
jgi:DNA repair exonuclease SbcCD ATPase subunit